MNKRSLAWVVWVVGVAGCGGEGGTSTLGAAEGSAPGQRQQLTLVGRADPTLMTSSPIYVSAVFLAVYRSGPDTVYVAATALPSSDGAFVLQIPLPLAPDAIDLGGIGAGLLVATRAPLAVGRAESLPAIVAGASRIGVAWRAEGTTESTRYPWIARFPVGASCGIVERMMPHDQLSPSPCVAIDVLPGATLPNFN